MRIVMIIAFTIGIALFPHGLLFAAELTGLKIAPEVDKNIRPDGKLPNTNSHDDLQGLDAPTLEFTSGEKAHKIKPVILAAKGAQSSGIRVQVTRSKDGLILDISEARLRRGIVVLDDGEGTPPQEIAEHAGRIKHGIRITLSRETLRTGIVVLDDGGGSQQGIADIFVVAIDEQSLKAGRRILDGSVVPNEVSGTILAVDEQGLKSGLSAPFAGGALREPTRIGSGRRGGSIPFDKLRGVGKNDVIDRQVSPYAYALKQQAVNRLLATVRKRVTLVGFGSFSVSRRQSSAADLSISKKRKQILKYGGTGSFSILVKNKGPGTATPPIVVVDTLPGGQTVPVGAFTAGAWSCKGGMAASSGQRVTCTYNQPIRKGKSVTLNLKAQVASAKAFPGGLDRVKNCATVSRPGVNAMNLKNNKACIKVTIVRPYKGSNIKNLAPLIQVLPGIMGGSSGGQPAQQGGRPAPKTPRSPTGGAVGP